MPFGEGTSDRGSGFSRTSAHCTGPVEFWEIFAEVAYVLVFVSQLCQLTTRRAQRSDSLHTKERMETPKGHVRSRRVSPEMDV